MCLLGYKKKKKKKSSLFLSSHGLEQFCRVPVANLQNGRILFLDDPADGLMMARLEKKKKIPKAEISPKLSSFYPPSTADKSSHVLHFNRFTLCYLHACSCLLRRLKILRKPNSKLEFLSSPDATCKGGVTFAWLMILKH